MLLIDCPWCGERAQIEFSYLGDAERERPRLEDGKVSPEAWFDYVYLRPNPRGPHAEHWQHTAGCRRWVLVLRDTHTHEILATGRPGEDLAKGRRSRGRQRGAGARSTGGTKRGSASGSATGTGSRSGRRPGSRG